MAQRPHRRRIQARRATVRRMLAAGAIAGILAGFAAQVLLGGVDPDIRGLVRAALLLPAGVFMLWWLLGPGIGADRDEAVVADHRPAQLDVDARLRRIEATFDDTAVPRVGDHHVHVPDPATAESLRRTLRRPRAVGDARQFRVRRA